MNDENGKQYANWWYVNKVPHKLYLAAVWLIAFLELEATRRDELI